MVGITSGIVDPAFTLNPGDHEFIKHESFINYPRARIIPVKQIERGLESSNKHEKFILKETADLSIVGHICRGLLESPHSSVDHREFYEKARKK